ncbi:MAG: class I SAM-dependent methyltransferase [Thermoplasmata archaeon]
MGLPSAARAFNDLSGVYDETRSPPDPATVTRVVGAFREASVGSLLEVGVGTGRFAGPLSEAGLGVTGVDAARRMMERARAKGVARLVQGSAQRLPFRDLAFDAALFVHVLHILDRPAPALAEAGRVSRVGVYALLTPSSTAPGTQPREDSALRLLREDLVAHGYPARERARSPGQREAELLSQYPPDETISVADREVTEPVAKRLEMVARRASRHFREVPPELLDPAIDRVRAQLADRTHTYRHREMLVRWRPTRWLETKPADPTVRTGAP